MKEMSFKLTGSSVERSTEKAILVKAAREDGEGWVKIWMPKSQTEVTENGRVLCTAWILEQKENEVRCRIEADDLKRTEMVGVPTFVMDSSLN
jgi:hypothetical protein